MSKTHAIQLDGSRFWVTHRRKTYGPFDYEWNSDFCGVVMLYDGQKFGEYCSLDELYADLKPFSLPMTLADALALLRGNKPLVEIFGERFVAAYCAVKENEAETFSRVISSWEREHLLLNV